MVQDRYRKLESYQRREGSLKTGPKSFIKYSEINKLARTSAKMKTLKHQTRQVEELIKNKKFLREAMLRRKKYTKLKDKQ